MILLAHGGAGAKTRPDEEEEFYQAGMSLALQAGTQEKNALRAVIATIQELERNPIFNAGRGGVLAEDGQVRLDASVATSDGQTGAIADSLLAHSAIDSAHIVMTQSSHTLLVGSGADSWLEQNGDTSPAKSRITEHQLKLWKKWQAGEDLDSLGTVGAVALDSDGNLAAGTSTGGLRGKQRGRAGDSAIVGAGTWCSKECAISCTGDGDTILARSSAARIAKDIEWGKDPKEAVQLELEALRNSDADAGCIVLLSNGQHWMMRNCALMNRGKASEAGINVPEATE